VLQSGLGIHSGLAPNNGFYRGGQEGFQCPFCPFVTSLQVYGGREREALLSSAFEALVAAV